MNHHNQLYLYLLDDLNSGKYFINYGINLKKKIIGNTIDDT